MRRSRERTPTTTENARVDAHLQARVAALEQLVGGHPAPTTLPTLGVVSSRGEPAGTGTGAPAGARSLFGLLGALEEKVETN